MRLIDADTVVTIQVYDDVMGETDTKKMTIADAIDEWSDEGCPPTIEAEPIRHGHWEWNDYGGFGNYHCTVCRYIPYGEFSMYCPRCGAKMDEEVQQNETD